jgi:hypothetical protein
MLPAFLVPELEIRENGNGPVLELGEAAGGLLTITLGIHRIIEQESLDLSIHGSEDGAQWMAKPLLAFPQKFYCGVYSRVLDLRSVPNVKYLRAQWKVNRWGRGEQKPLFGIYVFAEPLKAGVLKAAAV